MHRALCILHIPTTTKNEVYTMSNKSVVKIPEEYNQEKLDIRINKAVSDYKKSFNAAIRISGPFSILLQTLEQNIKEGRSLRKGAPAMCSGTDSSCYLEKTAEEQAVDIAKITEQVIEQYNAEIEADRERNIALLADQLYQAELKKEQQVQEKKDAERKAKALATATEHFTQTTKTQ